MTRLLNNDRSCVLLPACTFPTECSDNSREAELVSNLCYVQKKLPYTRLLVADNGRCPPRVPAGVALIHDRGSWSDNPSIGECRNLLNGLRELDDEDIVIKLHARCKLLNFGVFEAFFRSNGPFFIASANMWGRAAKGYDAMPYIDTRVFVAKAGVMRRILLSTLDVLMAEGARMEQAMLAVVLRHPDDCELIHTRGRFFPILDGSAGHGRQYSSPAGLTRSHVKAVIYRLGL